MLVGLGMGLRELRCKIQYKRKGHTLPFPSYLLPTGLESASGRERIARGFPRGHGATHHSSLPSRVSHTAWALSRHVDDISEAARKPIVGIHPFAECSEHFLLRVCDISLFVSGFEGFFLSVDLVSACIKAG